MLVMTPEEWEVVTRNSTGDIALVQLVKLLIIDEIHLLHEDFKVLFFYRDTGSLDSQTGLIHV